MDGLSTGEIVRYAITAVTMVVQLWATVKVLSVKLDGLVERVKSVESIAARAHDRIDNFFERGTR